MPSDTVNQDVQGTLQSVAMFRQRAQGLPQINSRHRCQLLHAEDPAYPLYLHPWREARKCHIAPRVTQWGHDARCINANQIGLQVHDKLPTDEAIKIELGHDGRRLEASELRQREAILRDLFFIGGDRLAVFGAPATVPFGFGGVDNRSLGKSGHVQTQRTRGLRNISVQRQIDLDPSHNDPLG